jgi:hypothetical protein
LAVGAGGESDVQMVGTDLASVVEDLGGIALPEATKRPGRQVAGQAEIQRQAVGNRRRNAAPRVSRESIGNRTRGARSVGHSWNANPLSRNNLTQAATIAGSNVRPLPLDISANAWSSGKAGRYGR